jgi:GNAT superfamily N-acetyltransferase
MEIRTAEPGDRSGVATVLDAAMLATPELGDRIPAGDVLVAEDGGPILGAVVVVPPGRAPEWARERGTDAHVAAVAVRRRRRGQGIGSALVDAVAESGRVTAAFDPDHRPFYEGLGFAVERGPDGRLRGIRDC